MRWFKSKRQLHAELDRLTRERDNLQQLAQQHYEALTQESERATELEAQLKAAGL